MEKGKLEELPYALRDNLTEAAKSGDISRLEEYSGKWKIPHYLLEEITKIYAGKGNLAALKWIKQNLSMSGGTVAKEASRNGLINVLKWAEEIWPGIIRDMFVIGAAAAHNQRTTIEWIMARNGGILPDRDKYIGDHAAFSGNVSLFRWLCEELSPSCDYSHKAFENAASGGHLELLQYLRSKYPTWDWEDGTSTSEACEMAAAGGHLDTLKWLRAQTPPCPFESAAYDAARHVHIHILEYLWEQPDCHIWLHSFERTIRESHYDKRAIYQWFQSKRDPSLFPNTLLILYQDGLHQTEDLSLDSLRSIREVTQDPQTKIIKATCSSINIDILPLLRKRLKEKENAGIVKGFYQDSSIGQWFQLILTRTFVKTREFIFVNVMRTHDIYDVEVKLEPVKRPEF